MKIVLNCFSRRKHVMQVVTAFMAYAQENKSELEIHACFDGSYPLARFPLIEAIIDDRKVILDLEDGCPSQVGVPGKDWIAAYLPGCDLYFKRSYTRELRERYQEGYKIHPLGLNYPVTCKGNPYNFKYLPWKFKIGAMVRKITGEPLRTEQFFRKDCVRGDSILFFVRLWKPRGDDPESAAQFRTINQSRIALVRELKAAFGRDFLGGLYDNETARELAPELIVPKKLTKQRKYMENMKKAGICIASTGLHDSIGWKFAEYICADKVIVSEKLQFEVPGPFCAGQNYFEFETPEECVKIIRAIRRGELPTQPMLEKNRSYYENYMRPEAMADYVITQCQALSSLNTSSHLL